MKAQVFFATPFRLPDPAELGDAVVVLDLAFCARSENRSYEGITLPFIQALGDRLKLWIDHHDHERNEDWRHDPRFVLVRRSDHPACPELVTKERVRAAGEVDSIVCHHDFDGIASAARFLRGGEEPYPGCDADARAIDSRIGEPSVKAERLAGALAVRFDEAMQRLVLASLVKGEESPQQAAIIDKAYASYKARVLRARDLACRGERVGRLWVMDHSDSKDRVDRTTALLEGQARAPVALFLAGDGRLTLACDASLDLNLCELFATEGGMKNRITLPIERLDEVLKKLD